MANGESIERIEEKMATRDDIRGIFHLLDEHTVILHRLDQERLFTIEWIRRIEDEVKDVKFRLKVA